MKLVLDESTGFFRDSNGRVCLRFDGWDTRVEHPLPDYVDGSEGATYVDSAADLPPLHDEYLPSKTTEDTS